METLQWVQGFTLEMFETRYRWQVAHCEHTKLFILKQSVCSVYHSSKTSIIQTPGNDLSSPLVQALTSILIPNLVNVLKKDVEKLKCTVRERITLIKAVVFWAFALSSLVDSGIICKTEVRAEQISRRNQKFWTCLAI